MSRIQNLSVLLFLDLCPVYAHWFHHVCPSICMYQLSSHWTDFYEVWYWKLLLKSVKKIHICFKSDNTRHFTWRPRVFHIVDSSMCSSTMLRTTILKQCIVVSPWWCIQYLYCWQWQVSRRCFLFSIVFPILLNGIKENILFEYMLCCKCWWHFHGQWLHAAPQCYILSCFYLSAGI